MSHHAPDLIVQWSPSGWEAFRWGGVEPVAANSIVGKRALVAVARRSTFVRTTRVPNTERATIRQILTVKASELFPLAPGEAAFDFVLLDDVNDLGRLALVMATSAADLRSLRAELTAAGVKIAGIVPEAYGSVLLAAKEGIRDAAIVGCADEGLTIDILSEGALVLSRTAPSGAPVLAEIRRSFASAGLATSAIVAAGGYRIDHADRTLSGSALHALSTTTELPHLDLPEAIAARERAATNAKIRNSLGLLVVGIAVAGYAVFDYLDKSSAVQAVEKTNATTLRDLKKVLAGAESAAQVDVERKNVIENAFHPAQKLTDVVTLMANRAPVHVWLTGVTAERGKTILARGTAKSSDAVASYLRRLTSEPRLRDVKLVFANNATIDKTPVVQFSVSAFPVGNLPLVVFGKGGKK